MENGPLLAAWEDCQGRTHSEVALRLLALDGSADPHAAAAWTLGQRDLALLDLRERWFGSDFEFRIDCPTCGERLELEISADELRMSMTEHHDGKVVLGDLVAAFRLPTSIDLAAAMREPAAADRRETLWRRCVSVERNGASLDDATHVPDELVDLVESAMAELDGQAIAGVSLTCPACTHGWDAPFDVVPVVWAEIDALARRRLADVHELALAYGWAEEAILGMSQQRRSFYLTQV